MSNAEKSLAALIAQYGETLVTRWALAGEARYLARKAPKVNPNKVANAALAAMTPEELVLLKSRILR